MAMKGANSQGIGMSGNCDVLDDTDLLEEILVLVPRESIFNCILVSKCWFGLISGSCFREHYVRRWSDEVSLLQRRLRSGPLTEVSRLKNRLQSQQLAALDHLQRRLATADQPSSGRLDQAVQRIRSDRVGVLSALRQNLPLDDAEIGDDLASMRLEPVNELLRSRESEVLGAVRESLEQLPLQPLAAVNEMQHQIVCRLLVAVNEVQCQIIWNRVVGVLLEYQVGTVELVTVLLEYLATAAEL